MKNPRAARLALTAGAIASLLAFSGCSEPGPQALLDGEKMINERRFESAVDRLNLAVHHLPLNAQAQNHLGLAYHGAGQTEQAAKAYRAALELDDNLASARFNLGSLLLEQGDAPGSVRELSSFVVLRPNSIEGKVRLGSAQIRADRWEDAAATFSEAFQQNPSNPEILNALGVIHARRGERDKAMPFFRKAVEQNPDYVPAKLNLAIYEHVYVNDKRSALASYRRFLLQHPTSPQSEAVAALTGALDRELNPHPAAPPTVVTVPPNLVQSTPTPPPPAGPGRIALAQRTERAAATDGNPRVESSTPTPDSETAPFAPEAMAFRPITERAAAPAAAPSAGIAVATTDQPAETSQAPLRPVQPESSPPRFAPAPPTQAPELPKPVVAAVRPDNETAEIAKTSPPMVEPVKPSAPPEKPAVVQAVAAPPTAPEPPAIVKTHPVEEAPATTLAPKPIVIVAVPTPVENPAPTTPTAPIPTSIDPSRAYRPDNRPRPEPEEQGFLKKLNPKRFFTSKEEIRTTPLPGSSPPSRATRPVSDSRPAARPAQPPPPVAPPTPVVQRVQPAPPPRPEPPRYAYVNPASPRAGDRQAASPVFLEGLKAHRDNRLSDAIKAYKSATLLDGSLYEAQYNLGLASYRANDLAESLRAYENALAVKPDSVSARYNFAEALKKAGFTRDAATELEKLLSSNPTQVSAHLAAGNLYGKELGESARARAHYLKVLELEPNHRQAQAIRYWLSENR